MDHGRHKFLLSNSFESVSRLTYPYWVNVSFLLWNSTLTVVHFSKFARIEVYTGFQFMLNEVSVNILRFIGARRNTHNKLSATVN